MNDVVAVEGIGKRFGSVSAVDDVTLGVAEGEFFALLGPSGCGKTTLLRLVAGFESPDAGRVWLDGRDITAIPPNRRAVNMMFQSYALFPHMSVAANVAYGLEMEGVPRPERSRRVAETLDLVQLGRLAERRPHQLSGGQRQRVALARALVKRPRVLLLDEPLAALDKKLRGEMQVELKRLHHETGIAFMVVTHDQEEALAMADRIALMRDGRVAQLESPRALYERPANRFVAGFIGLMNFFEGRSVQGGVEVAGLGALKADGGGSGVPATLAIRPERLRVHLAPTSSESANVVSGTVEDIAYLGQDQLVRVRVAGLVAPVMARVGSAADVARRLTVGQKVWCEWAPADGHVFLT